MASNNANFQRYNSCYINHCRVKGVQIISPFLYKKLQAGKQILAQSPIEFDYKVHLFVHAVEVRSFCTGRHIDELLMEKDLKHNMWLI
jgi:hypothetical protein